MHDVQCSGYKMAIDVFVRMCLLALTGAGDEIWHLAIVF